MNLVFYRDSIDRLHQENLQFLKAQQHRSHNNMPFAAQVECEAARRLRKLGYEVGFTSHKATWDLDVRDGAGRVIRVEVKGSQVVYLPKKQSWRYQADVRNGCDVLLFACLDPASRYHFFVIPQAELGTRRNIAIWSEDPAAYRGQWAVYREEWGVVGWQLAGVEGQVYQVGF